MSKRAYIAIDLGAESGRAVVGVLQDGKIALHEAYRFTHLVRELPSGLHWDLTGIWTNVLEGIRAALAWSRQEGLTVASLGVDTWGVDWGLIDRRGELLGLPHCYRDPQNTVAFEKLMKQPGAKAVYDATGIQNLALNTLSQYSARNTASPWLLEKADKLLFMADLFHFFLTGRAVNEATMASTSQMTDARTGNWNIDFLESLGLPTHMLGEMVAPGTLLGPIRAEIAAEVGADCEFPVVAPATHDTAAAVAAVPAVAGTNWCYCSSGTWSLMGAELDAPCITEAGRDVPFTNEGGVDGTIRFLTNIIGLWLVQECRRAFEKAGHSYDYGQLTELASKAAPFQTILDTDHPPFVQPGRMPEKIAEYAKSTGQHVPSEPGEFIRCCLESLALVYRRTQNKLEEVTDRHYDVLHVVGGGGKNELLNQFTADALGRRLLVGPAEATAVGNVLTQALGTGDVGDIAEIRSLVSASFQPKTFQPENTAGWDEAYQRFLSLRGEA